MVKREEIEELKEKLKEITIGLPKIEVVPVRIIFDGKQHSIRIPKRFTEALRINIKKDSFEFRFVIPQEPEEKPGLTGEFIHG
jgi:hypothetical protein